MIRRTTWILVAVFVVLIGLVLILQRREVSEPSEPSPTPVRALLEISEDDITKLWIEDSEGNSVELNQDKSGMWVLIKPPVGATDTSMVGSAVSQLITSKVLTTIDPALEMEVIGLAEPDYMISIETNSGQRIEIIVGKVTATDSGYYVRVNDDAVTVVSKFGIEAITNLIENPPVLITPTAVPETTVTATP
jgi:hypothetical protein